MSLTNNPKEARESGIDPATGMQNKYAVLSEDERAKGYVRPVRYEYKHVGSPAPANLRDLTDDERETYTAAGYAKFEEYPEGSVARGRFWKQSDLDRVNAGCGAVTWMNEALAQTYARQPDYYTGTYCARCRAHFPVGPKGEFVWDGTDERVGT